MGGVMMRCGCASQGLGRKGGEPESAMRPACITHSCFEVAEAPPDLTNRMARCAYFGPIRFRNYECNYAKQTGCTRTQCRCELPSDPTLPFFKYQGAGSPSASKCRRCGFYEAPHAADRAGWKGRACRNYEPRGDIGRDEFFCGCAGWD